MLSADLTFVHLSDIHFRKKRSGTAHDADQEIREALEFDLRRLVPRFGPVNGLIVTGDVAWSGNQSEYTYADAWIRQIIGHLQCPLSSVMITPGNHDVDRAMFSRNDKEILRLQRQLRKGGDPAVTTERLSVALSGKRGKLLVRPLSAYNRFARQFNCSISPDEPYWERRFALGDGSVLKVRGITSTWLSGPDDSDKKATLLYGLAQYVFTHAEGCYHVVAGHHPPSIMIDRDDAEKAFDFHCRLQMFGHKHNQWITASNTCTRIFAGALQPDRRERPWSPRYNVLQFSGEAVEKGPRLTVRIYPRRWSEEFRQFMADYTPNAEEFRDYEFNG